MLKSKPFHLNLVAVLFALWISSFSIAAPLPSPTPVKTDAATQAANAAKAAKDPTALLTDQKPLPDNIQFQIVVVNGAKEIWATWPGGSEKVADTMTLSKDTPYFHWTDPNDERVLTAQHGYTRSGFEKVYKNSKIKPEAQGPGYYASLSPFDSETYGPKVLMGKAPDGFTLVKSSQLYAKTINGLSLRSDIVGVNDRLKKLGIDGMINDESGTWMSLLQHRTVRTLKAPTGDELLASLSHRNQIAEALQAKAAGNIQLLSGQAAVSVNPLQAVQTYYQKGYLKEQAPNAWLAKNGPEWNKILLGQPLSDAEKTKIDQTVENSFVSDLLLQTLRLGTFSKNDPHVANMKNYFKSEADRLEDPAIRGEIEAFAAKDKAYDDAMKAYQATPAYTAYQAAMIAFYKDPATIAAQQAAVNYYTSPPYLAYQTAVIAFRNTPAYVKFQNDSLTYQKSPAFVAYQAAFQQFATTPAFKQWEAAWIADPKNTPNQAPGAPVPPPGIPIEPPGEPVRPTQPKWPVGPAAPPPPVVERAQAKDLSPAAQKIYSIAKAAETLPANLIEGEFKPDPLPTNSPEDEKKVKRAVFLGCFKRFLRF